MEPGFLGRIIRSDIGPANFDAKKWHATRANPDLFQIAGREQIAGPSSLKAFPPPDTEAVIEGCAFLKATQDTPDWIEGNKPLVAAAMSVLVHVAGTGTQTSKNIAHRIGSRIPGIEKEFLSTLIENANGFGPRTCMNINAKCGDKSKCEACPHWGQISSPIMIKGPDYIASESTGFHKTITKQNGEIQQVPDYDGLRRYFYKKHPYKTREDSKIVFKFNGVHYEQVFDSTIEGFAQDHFRPMPKNATRTEFKSLILCTELSNKKFWEDSIERKMNFQNGVLDIDTMKLSPHSKALGFRNVLPYEYNPSAKCPRFEQFLNEVTLNRQELIDIILEFAGYSLSNDKCWEQKAIVLQGEGRNGKSKLVTVIKALAGEGNSTALTLIDLEKDTNRYSLDGSLFNIAEETPSKSLMDSSLFKNLVSGGEISVKYLYKQPYTIRNRTKFWIICNEMPRTFDKSYAMFRRLMIVPFEATFEGDREDKHIEEKLMCELPGILNLVLAHYKKMREQRGISESSISKSLVEGYKLENDNVARWFTEECYDDGESVTEYGTKPHELYESYKAHVEKENETACTAQSFYRRIANTWRPYKNRVVVRREPGGPTVRVVLGVRLKSATKVVRYSGGNYERPAN